MGVISISGLVHLFCYFEETYPNFLVKETSTSLLSFLLIYREWMVLCHFLT